MKNCLCQIVIVFLVLPYTAARVAFGNMLCKKQSDCQDNQCCAMVAVGKSRTGFCMPAKQLGDRCAPTFIYGKSFTCGCQRGLSCALVEVNEATNSQKHRCVKVLPDLKEKRKSNGSTSLEKEKATFTAQLIRELLSPDFLSDTLDEDEEKKAT
ncbi:colipase-like isoform X2 [Clytia hemisphaerica]|uniref:Prokineticin domain-containing protein n=1 Tax=Clytia hemisphaerica TaxID=252671 RepID=A0A7M5VDU5_9CNID